MTTFAFPKWKFPEDWEAQLAEAVRTYYTEHPDVVAELVRLDNANKWDDNSIESVKVRRVAEEIVATVASTREARSDVVLQYHDEYPDRSYETADNVAIVLLYGQCENAMNDALPTTLERRQKAASVVYKAMQWHLEHFADVLLPAFDVENQTFDVSALSNGFANIISQYTEWVEQGSPIPESESVPADQDNFAFTVWLMSK